MAQRREQLDDLWMNQQKEEIEDLDGQWDAAASEDNTRKLTILMKKLNQIDIGTIETSLDMAKQKGNNDVIMKIQAALNKKRQLNGQSADQVNDSPAEKQQPSSQESSDLDSQWMDAVEAGNGSVLAKLIKSIDGISLDVIQMSHDQAVDEGIKGVTRYTQLALQRKQKVKSGHSGSGATATNKYSIQQGATVGNTGDGKLINMTGDNISLVIN